MPVERIWSEPSLSKVVGVGAREKGRGKKSQGVSMFEPQKV